MRLLSSLLRLPKALTQRILASGFRSISHSVFQLVFACANRKTLGIITVGGVKWRTYSLTLAHLRFAACATMSPCDLTTADQLYWETKSRNGKKKQQLHTAIKVSWKWTGLLSLIQLLTRPILTSMLQVRWLKFFFAVTQTDRRPLSVLVSAHAINCSQGLSWRVGGRQLKRAQT